MGEPLYFCMFATHVYLNAIVIQLDGLSEGSMFCRIFFSFSFCEVFRPGFDVMFIICSIDMQTYNMHICLCTKCLLDKHAGEPVRHQVSPSSSASIIYC